MQAPDTAVALDLLVSSLLTFPGVCTKQLKYCDSKTPYIYIYQEYTKTYIPKSKQKHSKTLQALSHLLVLVVIVIIILVLTLAGFTSLECNDGLAEHGLHTAVGLDTSC